MTRKRWSRMLVVSALAATTLVTLPGGAAQAVGREEVNVGDFFFNPDPIVIREGDTVTWDWVGQAPHNVTSSDGLFASKTLYEGADYSVTFPAAGTYDYFCTLHGSPDGGGMAGTVIVEPDEGIRLGGGDNVADALAWSQFAVEDGGAPTAILGRSDLFADSLSSGSLQGKFDAPLLLTPPNRLDDRVARELSRIGAGRVIILGGTQAISPAVEQALADRGLATERLWGADRLETALAVARRYFLGSDTVIVARATGEGTRAFVDALAAGGLAANRGWPVVFTPSGDLSPSTARYLQQAKIKVAVLAGGEQALSAEVQKDLEALGIEVQRAAGQDRYQTALALASHIESEGDGEHGGFANYLPIVEGGSSDAWASGFAAALVGQASGVVLTPDDGVPDDLYGHLINGRPIVVCGTGVSAVACTDAAVAASVPEFFQDPLRLAVLSGDGTVDEGASGAEGAFELRGTIDPNTVCYSLFFDGIDGSQATAAHIHAGDASVSGGPAVVSLVLGKPFGDPNDTYGCTTVEDASLIEDIFANPTQYYVNLHTQQFPNGAIRGQLLDPSFNYLTDMTGDQEVPGPGDDQGFGFAAVVGNTDVPDEVCVVYFAMTSTPAVAAHIHEGEPGESGPPVVTLEALEEGRFLNAECVDTDDAELVAAIAANPHGYYVNVHTEALPGGAVRGNLVDPWPPVGSAESPRQPSSLGDAARS